MTAVYLCSVGSVLLAALFALFELGGSRICLHMFFFHGSKMRRLKSTTIGLWVKNFLCWWVIYWDRDEYHPLLTRLHWAFMMYPLGGIFILFWLKYVERSV